MKEEWRRGKGNSNGNGSNRHTHISISIKKKKKQTHSFPNPSVWYSLHNPLILLFHHHHHLHQQQQRSPNRLSRSNGAAAHQRVPLPFHLLPLFLGSPRRRRVRLPPLRHRHLLRSPRRSPRCLVRRRRGPGRTRQAPPLRRRQWALRGDAGCG